ncbi:MAG: LCP family protein, partial [Bacilli bacterium]|nr:LCP family protein [Bacilli bacterium]
MSSGKRAKNGKSDSDKLNKSKKNRLEKEVEIEKSKADVVYDAKESFDKTGEVKVITDEDIQNVELSTKEKIYKALEEETKRIEFEDVDEQYEVYDEVKRETDEVPTTKEVIKRINELDDEEDEEDSQDNLDDDNSEEEDLKEVAKNQKRKEKKEKRKKNRGLRIFTIVVTTLVIVFCAAVLCAYLYVNGKFSKMNYEAIDTTQIGINEQAEAKLKGYRTFALFGVDTRSDDYDDSDNRSDSIILVVWNQDTNEFSLVSIYRDSFVDVDENGYTRLDKINHAFAYGGIQNSLKSINQALDLNVKDYIAVNFFAVIDAVDALGGFDLNITSDEMRVMNSTYIPELNRILPREMPGYGHVESIQQAGVQHVDGAQTLAYCRVRYTSGGDYKRTERMRTILNMILNKVKKLSVPELNNFIDRMLPKIKSNIKASDLIALAPNVFNLKITDTNVGWPYELAGWTGEAWYVVPATLESNVVRLHQEVYGDEDYEVSETVQDMSDRIIRKTGVRYGEDSNEFNHVVQNED